MAMMYGICESKNFGIYNIGIDCALEEVGGFVVCSLDVKY